MCRRDSAQRWRGSARKPRFSGATRNRGRMPRVSLQQVAEPAIKPGSVVDNHSSRPCLAAGLKQRTRGRVEPTHSPPTWPCSGWGLPCHAALAPHAVSSYLTVSPLPRTSCDAVRRFVFCCTFRRLAPPRRYLAPCSVEPGLSSARSSRDAVVLADSATVDYGVGSVYFLLFSAGNADCEVWKRR